MGRYENHRSWLGDYITIVRKEKGKENWFIGAVTDENSRTAMIPPYFLDKGKKYIATIYRDADNTGWKNNPEAYQIEERNVDVTARLSSHLAPGGGTAVGIVHVQ